MTKRITVVMDDSNVRKLRTIQAKRLAKSTYSVSFSSLVNEAIEESPIK